MLRIFSRAQRVSTVKKDRGARVTAVAAAAFALSTAAPSWALFVFENPAPGSFQSGVTVFSGWVCDADDLRIVVDKADAPDETLVPAYGTSRGDTAAVCGDSNNGFGVLVNLNRFGEGERTAKFYIDDELVDTRTFTVTTPTDEDFPQDLEGAFTLPDFPEDGDAIGILWQTGTQGFTIVPAGTESGSPASVTADAPEAPAAISTLFNFENPGHLTYVSGVTVFSGWICDADEVKIVVHRADDVDEMLIPAYGTGRNDTIQVCGDSNNGFGVLVNVNRFGAGQRTAQLFIDGELATTHTFSVTTPTDEDFPQDLDGEFRLPGFPEAGQDTTVIWQTAQQNFAIKDVGPTEGPTPTPGATQTPAPTQTPALCGNGVLDPGEECDGANLDGEDCESLFGGFEESGDDPCSGSTLTCTEDCTFDGRACLCNCEDDFNCFLPDGHEINCTPTYCTDEVCSEDDLPFCECIIDDFNTGCIEGRCLTTPFEGNLNALCFGLDYADPEFPPCDFCEF